ncbi:hypothetical protein V6N13_068879 [Hibiscus sabdariffa]
MESNNAGHVSFVTPILASASSENFRHPRHSYRKPKVSPTARDVYPKLKKSFYKFEKKVLIKIIGEARKCGGAFIGLFCLKATRKLKSKLLDLNYISEELIETKIMKVEQDDKEHYFETVEDYGDDEENKNGKDMESDNAGHGSFVTPILASASSENSRPPRPSNRKPKAVRPSEPVKLSEPVKEKVIRKNIIREARRCGEAFIGLFSLKATRKLKSKLLDPNYISEELTETRIMKVEQDEEECYFETVQDDGDDEENKNGKDDNMNGKDDDKNGKDDGKKK